MNKKVIIILSAIFLFILFLALIFYFGFFNKKENFCNDETIYNKCSKIKPYFCSNGTLIEKAPLCGCSNISEVNNDNCVSKYQNESKNITLYYTLKGKKQEINFTVYKGGYDYLSELPRYINSDENPTLFDFKLKAINEEQQRELLLPLVVKIENLAEDKEEQARIAISLVQNIPFGSSNKTFQFGDSQIEYSRYPYEVLYDMQGICSEKSELLVFLLREIGYETAFLYYNLENHEAVGIKCPEKKSLDNTGYCFIETTGPSIITDDKTEYFGIRQLNSTPKIIKASEGISLGNNLYEYKDAKTLIEIRESVKKYGTVTFFQHIQFEEIKKKYGLINPDGSYQF